MKLRFQGSLLTTLSAHDSLFARKSLCLDISTAYTNP
jgi:hypothetical protein